MYSGDGFEPAESMQHSLSKIPQLTLNGVLCALDEGYLRIAPIEAPLSGRLSGPGSVRFGTKPGCGSLRFPKNSIGSESEVWSRGHSVRDVISCVEALGGRPVPFVDAPRRPETRRFSLLTRGRATFALEAE